MVNVGSLPVEGNALFDLETQAGITAVLLALRASDISAAEKNELRDLIFLYSSGGKDETVRRALEQKISQHNLKPSVQKTIPAQPKVERTYPPIGTFRSAPSFTVPPAPAVKAAVPPPTPEPAIPQVEITTPVPEPQPVQVPVTSAAIQTPAPEPEVIVPPVTMPKADQNQYLDRIREIKASVNEKVGNPVNLVDINNEVGREYMSALLDAMKRINSGMSAESAMQRLEAAYASVEVTLQNNAAAVSVAPEPQPEPVVPPPVATNYTPAPEPQEPVSAPMPRIQEQVAPVSIPLQYTPPVAPSAPPPPQTPPPVAPMPNYSQPTPVQYPTIHQPTPHTFSSLADMVQQSHAQTGLPTTPAAATPLQSGDPLLSPEVEEGLNQLLMEWSIFKKSGIFGTGPKGREHPLYKKMAELQIPLLLAGRFEGATQEVRQSVTDYMNGWRYEQGLIYEKGETFEHYLRRVIRHILDQHTS